MFVHIDNGFTLMVGALNNHCSLADIVDLPATIMLVDVRDYLIDDLVSSLSEAEYARMQRFRKDGDARRYAVAHYFKRFFLSQYVSLPMSELCFETYAQGKPFCKNINAPYFNVSHSGDWVALSVSREAEVGVDVEFSRAVSDELVRKVSSNQQFIRYQCSPSPSVFFLTLWTQKEAVSKACGFGISVGLDNIECTGDLGGHSLDFNDSHYYLYSYSLPDNGVLSYAATAEREPAIIKVNVSAFGSSDSFEYTLLKEM